MARQVSQPILGVLPARVPVFIVRDDEVVPFRSSRVAEELQDEEQKALGQAKLDVVIQHLCRE